MREVERYTSPSRHEAEKRVLFRRLPIVVGRESELPEPGRFFTHDAAGVALLLTRDDAGKVHAMLNVCRHRGTRLVYEEQGSAQSTAMCRSGAPAATAPAVDERVRSFHEAIDRALAAHLRPRE
jgi:phenylpropionate dioxygenase-like ring-hydroxylating dioxygenase large terminal subunit